MRFMIIGRTFVAALVFLGLGTRLGVYCALGAESVRLSEVHVGTNGAALGWTAAGSNAAFVIQWRETITDGIWRLPPAPGFIEPLRTNRWVDGEVVGTDAAASRFYQVAVVEPAERGRVLEVTAQPSMMVAEVEFALRLLAGIEMTVQYGVDIYALAYETVGPWGERTQASGLMIIPRESGRAWPLVSYQHGTLVRTNDAPSVNPAEALPGVGFGSVGYVVAVPDLLGLGRSPGLHPYHHARSEATAAIDLLRAVRTWCATNGVELTGELFLTGYSQGGHATMALHRELEQGYADEFPVAASAPMAGAYDLSGATADDMLSGRPMPNPYYFLLLGGAYQSVYRFTGSLADLLAPPYASTLPPLLNGNTSSDQLNAAMPASPAGILKPEVLAALQAQPRHPLRLALQENDVYQWTPRAPMRLFHCSGDRDVIYANSQVALAEFHRRGALQVELVDPSPGADHGGCAVPAFLRAREWFDSLRAAGP